MSRVATTRRGGPVARFSAWYARRAYGQLPTALLATAHSPAILRGYVAFIWELGRARRLDRRLKDLAGLKAAALAGCEYCLDIGSAEARRSGVTPEQLADLPRYRTSDHFDDDERLVLDYATAMTQTPLRVGDDLFDRLRARFDEEQIVELTAAIAWENYRARFNWALDLEPQGFSRGACALPERPAAPATAEASRD
jgi:AhpD family alkylhydroperoxidase